MKRTTVKQPQTPECDKLAAARPQAQVVGDFLTWLQDEGIELATWGENDDGDEALLPLHYNIEPLIAKFLDIDLNKVENERRAILDVIRKNNAKTTKS